MQAEGNFTLAPPIARILFPAAEGSVTHVTPAAEGKGKDAPKRAFLHRSAPLGAMSVHQRW